MTTPADLPELPPLTNEHAWNLAQAVYAGSQPSAFPEPQILLTPSELVRFFELALTDQRARAIRAAQHEKQATE